METVGNYIDTFPMNVQEILHNIREIIQESAPTASESIAYKMPAYKLNGKPLIYFAAYKIHIGLYALPTTNIEFSKELSIYKQGKGSIQFPLDKAIPYDLIKRIVEFRVIEILSKNH